MIFRIRHAARLAVRQPGRSVSTGIGVAIAAALIAGISLFGVASGATVTRRALSGLTVDAQVVLAPGADPAAAESVARADPAVRSAAPFALAHFDNARLDRSAAATQTSAGVIVGIDPAYPASTGLFRIAQGAARPGQVAISRDLATNLGATPGDRLTFALPGGGKATLTVSGIVDISGADLLLGPLDAAHRTAGANPPTNVAEIDRASMDSLVIGKIPKGAVATEPASSTGATAPVFAPEAAVRRELHVRYNLAAVPGDPVEAQRWLDLVRHRIERAGAGSFQLIDDAGATLEPVAADLAWGQILFIFLALPGILLALALSFLAADATADATRRHAALLRARGASGRKLREIFLAATALVALGGAAFGAAVGIGLALFLNGAQLASTDERIPAIVRAGALAIGLPTILATTAAAWPLRKQLNDEVAAGRRQLQRDRPPLWQRLYLDLAAIVAAVAVYLLFGGAVHPLLGAEGNPTVSLALSSFLAPLLFWSGGTLLLLRVAGGLMRRGRGLRRLLGRLLGPGGELASHTLASRGAEAGRAIVILALSVSFATSVLIFDATYRQQQRVDAELSLGADLRLTSAAPIDAGAVAAVQGRGISGATPFVDRVVYVGSEAQDMLAIDPTGLAATSPLSDTYFKGITAQTALAKLRAQPDAIFVSAETATDYSIVVGDRIRIRAPDASGVLREVDFRMAGIALEFPTAPKDAFLVANQSYLAAKTGNKRISFVLARADGDLGAAAAAVTRRLGPGWQVADLSSTNGRLANSITSVDLSELVLLDLGFAVLIGSLGVALFLLAGLAARRRELATLEAIGAEPGQLRAAIAGEAGVVGAAGIVAGLTIGALVGVTLLQVLAGIFDPPASFPAVPIAALGGLLAGVLAGLAVALLLADRGLAHLPILSSLRER